MSFFRLWVLSDFSYWKGIKVPLNFKLVETIGNLKNSAKSDGKFAVQNQNNILLLRRERSLEWLKLKKSKPDYYFEP